MICDCHLKIGISCQSKFLFWVWWLKIYVKAIKLLYYWVLRSLLFEIIIVESNLKWSAIFARNEGKKRLRAKDLNNKIINFSFHLFFIFRHLIPKNSNVSEILQTAKAKFSSVGRKFEQFSCIMLRQLGVELLKQLQLGNSRLIYDFDSSVRLTLLSYSWSSFNCLQTSRILCLGAGNWLELHVFCEWTQREF